MRTRIVLGALLAGLGLALLGSLPVPAADPPSPEQIQKLVDQLGSATFSQRQKAAQALDAIGPPALDALRKAAKSGDPEVKRRAEELVEKIAKRAESASLLAAKRVHLVYKDTPVTEAVADFQKKSGYHFHLHDPEGKLKERTITLDTGETTFWHAFDLFCAKAGLVEATMQDLMGPPVPPPGGAGGPGAPGALPGGAPVQLPQPEKPQPIRKPIQKQLPPRPGTLPAQPEATPRRDALNAQVAETRPAQAPAQPAPPPQPAPAVQIQIGPANGPAIAPAPPGGIRFGNPPILRGYMQGQIILKAGKPKKLPTDDTSAVRVRAMAKADVFGAAPEGEILLGLEVAPEPKLQWQYLQSVRIDKAVDDQGQTLSQVMPMNPVPPGAPGIGFGGGAPPGAPGGAGPVPPGRPVAVPGIWWGGGGVSQAVPVHLKKGEKAAKSLKELKGVVTAQVLTDARPFITADNLAKAAGKTFKGTDGGSIKVTDVKTQEGQTTLEFEFEQPAGVMADQPGMNRMPPPVGGRIGGGPIRIQPAPVPPAAVPPPPPPAGPAPAAGAGQAVAQPAQVAQVRVQVQGRPAIAPVPGFPGGAPTFTGPFNGLTVQDDKGNALPIQIRQSMFRGQGAGGMNVFAYTVVCVPQKDQGQPAKIVFSGRKSVSVEVPFTLKEVPLP